MSLRLMQQFSAMRTQFSESLDDMDAREMARYESALEEVFKAAKQHEIFILEKAKILECRKDYKQALPLFQQSSKNTPNSSFVLFKEGVCLQQLNRNDEAIEKYKECIASDPESFVESYREKELSKIDLKGLLFSKFKLQHILDSAKSAQHKHIQDAMHALAELLYDQNQFKEAIEFFSTIKPTSIFYRDALYAIARAYLLLKAECDFMADTEIDELKVLLENHPDFTESWIALGKTYELNQKIEKAVYCYRKVLEIEAESKDAIMDLAWLLCEQEDHEAIINLLENKVALFVEEPMNYIQLFSWLIKSYFEQQKFSQALKALEEADPLLHPIAQYWNDKGVVLFALDQHEESLEAFEEALRREPHNPLILKNVGDCYMQFGLLEPASFFYSTAIKKGSKDPVLFGRAIIALAKSGKVQEALDVWECVEEFKIEVPAAKYCHAMALKADGQIHKAISVLEECLEEDEAAKEDEEVTRELEELYKELRNK